MVDDLLFLGSVVVFDFFLPSVVVFFMLFLAIGVLFLFRGGEMEAAVDAAGVFLDGCCLDVCFLALFLGFFSLCCFLSYSCCFCDSMFNISRSHIIL